MKHGIREQLGARATLVQTHLGKTRQMHETQDDDDQTDDGRDAEDLLALDPEAHGRVAR
jgi:hypothetical protein